MSPMKRIESWEIDAENYELAEAADLPMKPGTYAVTLFFNRRSGRSMNIAEVDDLRRLALAAPDLRDALTALYSLRGQMEKPEEHAETRRVFALVEQALSRLP